MSHNYKVIWEKFKLPQDIGSDDDDDDDEVGYPYEDKDDNPISKLINSQQNPFHQLHTFNLWIVHCNFVITRDMIKETHRMLGIESMDIITPYRMYIGIGTAFEESDVKFALQNKLLELANVEQTEESE